MIDFILLAILACVTWFVSSDGPWGAAITFISVVFAGILAMNFFEPLAGFLTTNLMGDYAWQHRWDVIALLGLFALFVSLFRVMGEALLPTYADVNALVYELARWGFGLASGYVVMAIVLTSLHTAPLPREFLGFTAERQNFLSITAPDRQWLGWTQYVSETSFRRRGGVVFDGPYAPKNPLNPTDFHYWSSFPIRYAARRDQYYGGSSRRTTPSFSPSPAGGGTNSVPGSGPPGTAPPSGGTNAF